MTEERVSGHGTGADRSDLAGQYALGLLDGDERVVFERRLKESAELRDEVARWQEHFTALGMNVYQSDLPLSVFDHLKRELWSENRLPWRRRIRIWEYALGGIAAALLAYFVYNSDMGSRPVTDVLQANIQIAQNEADLTFVFNPVTALLHFEYDDGQELEGSRFAVWVVKGDAAPVSFGVIPVQRHGALRLNGAQSRSLRAGVMLAVSQAVETPEFLGMAPLMKRSYF
jgi:anti-sigma-K factor RskA